jgi:hypothetical protein
MNLLKSRRVAHMFSQSFTNGGISFSSICLRLFGTGGAIDWTYLNSSFALE